MKKIDITPQELCERLFNGESFYDHRGSALFYQDNKFMVAWNGGVNEDADINEWFPLELHTRPHWTDNLSEENPVLCWVWNDEREHAIKRDVITAIETTDPYETDDSYWTHAEPVKLEDACIWEGE